jgi:ribose transport system substrate-binding protein
MRTTSSDSPTRSNGLFQGLFLLLCIAVLMSALAACGSGTGQEQSDAGKAQKTDQPKATTQSKAQPTPAPVVTETPKADMNVALTPGGADRPLKLAFVTNNPSDFWTIARAGVDAAVAELKDVTVEFRMPADGTAGTQKQIIDDLLVKKFDGIAVSPVDPANMSSYLADVSKQTLLFTQDSDADPASRACYVGSDNVAAGRMAGEAVKEILPEGGDIMLFVGVKDAQNARERIQGIEEVLKDSKVKVVDIRTDDTDRARAKGNVSDALIKNPNLKCLVGLWSYNGPAILNAVKDAKNEDVKIVTFDEEDETLSGVESGRIAATIVQQPYQFGYQAIQLMTKVLREGKQALPADGRQVVPTRKITKENVGPFKDELVKQRRGGK